MPEKATVVFRNASLDRLQPVERDLAIAGLELSTRTRNCLDRVGIHTVGRLVQVLHEGLAPPRAAGEKVVCDIEGALKALSLSVQPNGRVDWFCYSEVRRVGTPTTVGPSAGDSSATDSRTLRINTTVLDSLMPSHRESALDVLHLRTRACTCLNREGVRSVGGLVDLARHGIGNLWAAGSGTITEIHDAISALSRSIRKDGSVDWIAYAVDREFSVLPEDDCPDLAPLDVLKILPIVARKAVESRYGSAEGYVLRHYLLRDFRRDTSLKKVGLRLGWTKQAVGLSKDKILAMLRLAIFDDRYPSCSFRFRHVFVAPFRRLRAALKIYDNRPLMYSEWKQILAQSWGIVPRQVAPLESFLLSVLGYDIVHPSAARFDPIILPRGLDSSAFTAALSKIAPLFRSHFPNGLSKRELASELRRHSGRNFSAAELPLIVGAVAGIEHDKSEERFRMRLQGLIRLNDKIERVLKHRGSAMHLREITAEIARTTRTSRRRGVRSIAASLTGNKRFTPIGRTGYWVLAEWRNVETRTIADVAAEILGRSKIPMTSAQLYTLILARRPLALRSVSRLLNEDARFDRVGPSEWRLKDTRR